MSLPAQTHVGTVALTVASLARSVAYYESVVGLRVHGRDGPVARLGTGGDDLLVLHEEPGARSARGAAGLFHVALLVPERADLAAWLAHAGRDRVRLEGLSDHAVSEAIYLRDPDDHGIELYWDRPRATWEGRVRELMTTRPLDVDDLLAGAGPFAGLPAGTVVGHVHLCVRDVPETEAFYRDLGLDVMAALGPRATFLSAGGYHHHVGANTWESAGRDYAPPGTARLREFTLVVPGGDGELRHDPSGIPFRLTAA